MAKYSVGEEICMKFPVTTQEYLLLDKKFGNLAEYAAWQLIKKNSRNNHTHNQEDIAQDLRIAIMQAGSYYKRQIYIEKCLELCSKYVAVKKTKMAYKPIIKELQYLWDNKTRHGASRQKFGPEQEKALDKMVSAVVPKSERPSKEETLEIDSKFTTYCKAITWNRQKAMGKKITREKAIRGGQVSLSEYDFLGAM